MALQVEMGHYSGDVTQDLQQITAAVVAIQNVSIASGNTGEALISEVSSLSSVSATDAHVLRRSSSHQPATSPARTSMPDEPQRND